MGALGAADTVLAPRRGSLGAMISVREARRRAKDALRHRGWDLRRWDLSTSQDLRRARLLGARDIDLVIDGGASVGKWAAEVRSHWPGPIVSFEPLSESYASLCERARPDRRWECVRAALGDQDAQVALQVASDPTASSLLELGREHLGAAPDLVGDVASEQVPVVRLDTWLRHQPAGVEAIYLKLDVQGFELPAIKGLGACSDRVSVLEMEVSFVEIYRGQALWRDAISAAEAIGLELHGIDPSLWDLQTGQVLQADVVLVRSEGDSFEQKRAVADAVWLEEFTD